jgi:hypothetical protein
MKKTVIAVILVYLIIAGIILLFVKDPADHVSIFHVRHDQAILLDSTEEWFDLELYFSEVASFFTDKANVDTIAIADDDQLISVSLKETIQGAKTKKYDQEDHYQFYFRLQFDQVMCLGGQFALIDAVCTIVYQNGVTLAVPIGNLTLLYQEISPIEHIDFTRLYGIVNPSPEGEYLAGIVIGLAKYPLGDVWLTDLETTLKNLTPDLSHCVILDEAIPPFSLASDWVAEDFSPIFSEETPPFSSSILLAEETLLLIPLCYQDQIKTIRQFPLIIHYRYLDTAYSFVMDDFLYFQGNDLVEEGAPNVWRTIYHY